MAQTQDNLTQWPPRSSPDVQYPPAEMSLSLREWIVALAVAAAALALAPVLWQRVEGGPPFQVGQSYRIPYELNNDYWLFGRWARVSAAAGEVAVIGDSVVWGHYVPAEFALPARLNAHGGGRQFANLGLDGIHPAAMWGLVEHYGAGIPGQDVLLHCNLLWMSSKRRDLQEAKATAFNHPRLVPQFYPPIPSYDELFEERLSIAIGRKLPFTVWANHLRWAYFDGKDIPSWTLDHPYENPLAALCDSQRLAVQAAPPDAQEVPWTTKGTGTMMAEWVDLNESFQWSCFAKTIEVLRGRGNRVFVVVGPFNEDMLDEQQAQGYRRLAAQAAAHLEANGVPHFVPAALPGNQYADASHPLRDGYDALARQLWANQAFVKFVQRPGSPRRRRGKPGAANAGKADSK